MAENYKDAVELTHEESYQAVSQRKLAQGEDDVIKTFCCISWRQCMRGIAEPLLQTTASFTELANNTQDLTGQCTNKMRFSCSDLRGSLEDDWHDYKMDKDVQQKKKLGFVASVKALWLWAKDLTVPAISNDMIRTTTIVATALSYVIVFTFILACIRYG